MLVFVSQFGYYFFYAIQLKQIRREIKAELFANIPESSLENIVIEKTDKELTWKDDGKEFYLHGELFDLVKTKSINGKTVLCCINDKKEKHLLNEFAKALKSQHDNGNGNKQGKHVVKFQLSEFTAFAVQTESFSPAAKQQFNIYDAALVSIERSIASPPPKA